MLTASTYCCNIFKEQICPCQETDQMATVRVVFYDGGSLKDYRHIGQAGCGETG